MENEDRRQIKFRLLIEDIGFMMIFVTFLCSLSALAGWGGRTMVWVALAILLVTVTYMVVFQWIFYSYRPLAEKDKFVFSLYRKRWFFVLKLGMVVLALSGIIVSLLGAWSIGYILFGMGFLFALGELTLDLAIPPERLLRKKDEEHEGD